MQATIIVTVTPEGNIELPPEVREKLQAGERFLVTLTEDTIILKKVELDWEELRKRREKLGNEQEEMSIEEICEIVREVRKEKSKL